MSNYEINTCIHFHVKTYKHIFLFQNMKAFKLNAKTNPYFLIYLYKTA